MSYLKIGGNWIRLAITHQWQLLEAHGFIVRTPQLTTDFERVTWLAIENEA